jgi:hypothetical protein
MKVRRDDRVRRYASATGRSATRLARYAPAGSGTTSTVPSALTVTSIAFGSATGVVANPLHPDR